MDTHTEAVFGDQSVSCVEQNPVDFGCEVRSLCNLGTYFIKFMCDIFILKHFKASIIR